MTKKRPTAELRSGRRGALRAIAGALVSAAALGGTFTVEARAQGISREYPLKAAFLYNFGNYVEWPETAFASSDAPFVLGVMGPNPFGTTLGEIAAVKRLQNRPIVVRQIATIEELAACHIVFIGGRVAESDRQGVVEATRGTPVLVVGESPGFAEQGAPVNFFVEQNKVRFEVNDQAARERRLKISSKLMSLARVVEPRSVVGK